MRAIMSNGVYLESKEGIEARGKILAEIEEQFDNAVDRALGVEVEEDNLEDNPMFAAGLRGLERLKWEYGWKKGEQQLPQAA